MSNLKQFSSDELRCRKDTSKGIPLKVEKLDFTVLEELIDDYIVFMTSENYYEDNDYKQYIYECVLETFYGEVFWEWLNYRNE